MSRNKILHNMFKLLFFVILTIKTISFVYENIRPVFEDNTLSVELVNENSDEPVEENEELSESSEEDIIMQYNGEFLILSRTDSKNIFLDKSCLFFQRYLTCKTPPPEFFIV